MRWIWWIAAVLAACLFCDAAAGLQPAAPPTGYGSSIGAYGAAAAPACCFPCFGMMPGCCEARPTCCDHVWNTYCQGKAYRLQRHAMRAAAHPPPVPYGQPAWYCPAGTTQPVPDAWMPLPAAAPLPDPISEAEP